VRPLNRRDFLWLSTAALAARGGSCSGAAAARFATRGVVLIPFDLTLTEWPDRVAQAGLNTIGLHAARRLDVLVKFVRSDNGQRFLAACQRLGLNVEYELHAMGDLLSREYFQKDPTMFRKEQNGGRNPEFNCCPSHPGALEIIAEAAVEFSRVLRPTTHRYFYWPDDGREWCFCDKCRGLSASEQALLVENHILRALRQHHDPAASVCHIAYGPTLTPPQQVRPDPGIFLEFAPITRSHDRPFAEQTEPTLVDRLEVFDANLLLFPRDTAQVLEYWLDNSRFSGWRRPAKKLPWNNAVFRADVEAYAQRGIRHVTSFACYIDAEYVQLHGEPWTAIHEYGQGLAP
jgi:hypothetical protein